MPTMPLPGRAAAVPPDLAAVLLALAPHPAMAAAAPVTARAMTPARLVSTALRLAAASAQWRQTVGFVPEERTATLIERCVERGEEYEAWALGWLPGQDTGAHDHIGSTAALCVVEGRLRLHSSDGRGAARTHALAPGSVRVIGSSDVHRLWNADAAPAVSIHVYAPRRSMRIR